VHEPITSDRSDVAPIRAVDLTPSDAPDHPPRTTVNSLAGYLERASILRIQVVHTSLPFFAGSMLKLSGEERNYFASVH